MLDLTNLKMITDGDQTMLNSLLDEFLHSTDIDLKALQTALDQQKHESIARLSHRIKGAAAIIGAEELVNLTQQLETTSHQFNLNQSSHLLDQITLCYQNVSEEIRHYK